MNGKMSIVCGMTIVCLVGAALPWIANAQTPHQVVVHDDGWEVHPVVEGTSFYLRGPLLNEDETKTGTGWMSCIVMKRKGSNATAACEGVASLAGGDMSFSGLKKFGAFAADDTLAVTGGTGDYAGANGTLHMVESEEAESPSGLRNTWTFDLLP